MKLPSALLEQLENADQPRTDSYLRYTKLDHGKPVTFALLEKDPFCYYLVWGQTVEGSMKPFRFLEQPRVCLKERIKTVIIEALMLEELTPADIEDGAPLFGEGLGLDSVDALELAIELERAFGVKIPDDEQSRSIFASVSTLATFIEGAQA